MKNNYPNKRHPRKSKGEKDERNPKFKQTDLGIKLGNFLGIKNDDTKLKHKKLFRE